MHTYNKYEYFFWHEYLKFKQCSILWTISLLTKDYISEYTCVCPLIVTCMHPEVLLQGVVVVAGLLTHNAHEV